MEPARLGRYLVQSELGRGATGKVYLVAVGLDGEPGKVEAQGRYDDVYVKTPQGWRFKQRTHYALLSGGRPATPPK